MTKLRWDRAGSCSIDPGRVMTPSDSGQFDRWISPQEQIRRRATRAKETVKLLARSEIIRYKAMIKKYGMKEAARLGVPQSFINGRIALEAREEARRAKNKARKERQKRRVPIANTQSA